MKLVKVSDLFEVRYGTSLELNALNEIEGGVAFVSRTTKNNGVSARVARLSEVSPMPAGTLTVALGGTPMTTFLQDEPYYTGRDVAVLASLEPMAREELLYYATCLAANRYRFSYGRQANRTVGEIMIPAREAIPEWVRPGKAKPSQLWDGISDDAFSLTAPSTAQLETSGWACFSFEQLFDIKKGKALTKDEMLPGDTPFVGASSFNNGVTARISQEPQHPAGALTVSSNGSVGEVFYQPEPFWASSDVAVFYPRFETSREVAIFLATLIRLEKFRYNYGRKWGLETMNKSILRLPVDTNGAPDFDAMATLVRQLPSWNLIENI